MSDRIGVGVVGLGYWGPNLLRVLTEMPGAHVRAICDLDADRLGRFAQRHPSVRATASFDDLLADPEIEAIVIATPVFTHYEMAGRSLDAGKHTFVEKPLAASERHATDLVARAAAQDLRLMCGHVFLYSPPVRAIHDLLARGELGEIYFISSSRVNLGLHQRDVSVVWDLGPHDFSILLSWLGESPTSVRAIGRDSIVNGLPDVAFIDLAFASGVIAHVELSWLSPSKLRRTVVVGSERMIVYEDGGIEPLRIFDHGVVYRDPETFGEYHLSYRTGDIVSPKLDTAEPLGLQLEDFFGLIRRGMSRTDHLDLACDVVGLIEATELSLSRDGERVPFEGAYGPVRSSGD
ncbi:MAG TPA: Gfo/Idh/MocA family oxidoreductase [Gaiellales bacterium]|jgi:predicted dehydrogenase